MILAPNSFEIKNSAITRKSNIKQMYYDLMRRELELLRVQDMLSDTFGDIQLFSKTHDECTAFDIIIYNAFATHSPNFHDEAYSYIIDGIFRIAFSYIELKSDVFKYYENHSEKIIDLIFKAGKEQSPVDSKILFLKGYIINFPHLNLKITHTQLKNAMEVKNASL